MSFEQLYNGQNELVLHVDRDPSSKVWCHWLCYCTLTCVWLELVGNYTVSQKSSPCVFVITFQM